MSKKTIQIDEGKCTGCGLCVSACKEKAIELVAGKARLVRGDHCDGLGNCLPACPAGAISFKDGSSGKAAEPLPCGCPGEHSKAIKRGGHDDDCGCGCDHETEPCDSGHHGHGHHRRGVQTHLNQWPIQIRLVPAGASYFAKAKLLVAADCTAFAYGNFHADYMKGRITLIGCPKLDGENYGEKLSAILKANEIKSVTVVRMEVPCCTGIEDAVKEALAACGKLIPWQSVVISTDGKILED
ncbi:MAG: 4Fe-4S binding protein [Spirochaetes bacterium]|nr:4Fe-4S binding protein [Spirochaetota bacterium]